MKVVKLQNKFIDNVPFKINFKKPGTDVGAHFTKVQM
jgi:hypothetical protein